MEFYLSLFVAVSFLFGLCALLRMSRFASHFLMDVRLFLGISTRWPWSRFSDEQSQLNVRLSRQAAKILLGKAGSTGMFHDHGWLLDPWFYWQDPGSCLLQHWKYLHAGNLLFQLETPAPQSLLGLFKGVRQVKLSGGGSCWTLKRTWGPFTTRAI